MNSTATLGSILTAMGGILIVLGIIRHFSTFILQTTAHASIILAVIGLVVVVIGAYLLRTGQQSGAA